MRPHHHCDGPRDDGRGTAAERPITFAVQLGGDGSQGGRAFAFHFARSCRQRMHLQPQRAGSEGRINASSFPPRGFIARAMDLAMMAAAQRHGELIADLAANRAVLREAQMMGICRPAPANQTRLFGYEPDVLLVTKAARLGMG
jgi:hypothetical protein